MSEFSGGGGGSSGAPTTILDYLYGDGSDGDLTVTTTVNPSREMYYDTLTIGASGAIAFNSNASCPWIFCQTLDLTNADAHCFQAGTVGAASNGSGDRKSVM
jgi:hypothetical protein